MGLRLSPRQSPRQSRSGQRRDSAARQLTLRSHRTTRTVRLLGLASRTTRTRHDDRTAGASAPAVRTERGSCRRRCNGAKELGACWPTWRVCGCDGPLEGARTRAAARARRARAMNCFFSLSPEPALPVEARSVARTGITTLASLRRPPPWPWRYLVLCVPASSYTPVLRNDKDRTKAVFFWF